MANVYKVFTVSGETVTEGADVGVLSLKGADIDIPAIKVGEEGRGRRQGVLTVKLAASDEMIWIEKNGFRIVAAEVGKTQAGAAKLIAKPMADSDEAVIVVFRTGIGFRGGNSHTGDRDKEKSTEGNLQFLPFPGEKLVEGVIAQGDAGGMGSGEQFVAVIQKGVVFRASRSGRLYGAPASHYYVWTGEKLIAATWDNRIAADLF
jgi:hypothetical protein